MGKAGNIRQFILKQLLRSADVNSLTAELGAHPIIGHDEASGARLDFDIGDPLSGTIGHVVTHLYQREGYKIKTVDSLGRIVHSADPTAITTIDIPIGGIIWWHKSLTGVPSLPSGWVECNGQVLSDSESLLDGQTMPNINYANGRFIRGGTTSGTTQSNQNKSHTHGASTVLEFLGIALGAAGGAYGFTSGGNYTNTLGATEPSHIITTISTTAPGSPDESRPDCISMVAIIRVK